MSYPLICLLQQKAIPVQQSCRVLEVSHSGFYKARRRLAKPMICKTSTHLQAAFRASHQSYGSRRLVTTLEEAQDDIHVGRHRVRRQMRKAGSIWRSWDLFSRKMVGWAMAPSMPVELVCAELRIAMQQRQPEPGLLIHSDRGSQYASRKCQA